MKCLLYICVSVHPFVCHICCINFYISLAYKDIFTKCVRNVYGCKNMSVQNFGLILKNKMAAIADCLKIIKVL